MAGTVDVALTTRELGQMIQVRALTLKAFLMKNLMLRLRLLQVQGAIFGATGGVMEAALRTAANMLDGDFSATDFVEVVRNGRCIVEATYNVAGN